MAVTTQYTILNGRQLWSISVNCNH